MKLVGEVSRESIVVIGFGTVHQGLKVAGVILGVGEVERRPFGSSLGVLKRAVHHFKFGSKQVDHLGNLAAFHG